MSDSVRPHRRQPTRLPCPWDSPGKNTGVSCHFLLQCMKVKSESEVAQSCLTLSSPMNCSPPGSSICGIFDRSSKQKINKETQALHDTLDEVDVINIFRIFHPNAEEYTFSSAYGTFSRIDNILGHKSKKTEVISRIFFNHNAMRPDINYKEKNCKKHKYMEIKYHVSK